MYLMDEYNLNFYCCMMFVILLLSEKKAFRDLFPKFSLNFKDDLTCGVFIILDKSSRKNPS